MGGWRYYDGSVVADLGTATGTLATASGGTATDTSGATGIASVNAGAWTFDPAFQYLGTTTPILKFGNDVAEDIIFQWLGNEQDWYIGLDDSANALQIGLGVVVGATEQLTFTATTIVFNEDAGDYDFRIEGGSNANMLVIDSTNSSVAFGAAIVDGAAFSFNNLTDRTFITVVGSQIHVPAQTQNFDNANGTIAVGASAFLGIPTWTNDNATLTITDAATLYIAGVPVDSTRVTATKKRSLLVGAGESAFYGNIIMGDGSAADFAIIFDGNEQDFYVALDDSDNALQLGLGSTPGATEQLTLTTTAITVNEDAGDYDFRVEGGSNANMIVMDSTNSSMAFGGAIVDGAAFTFNALGYFSRSRFCYDSTKSILLGFCFGDDPLLCSGQSVLFALYRNI